MHWDDSGPGYVIFKLMLSQPNFKGLLTRSVWLCWEKISHRSVIPRRQKRIHTTLKIEPVWRHRFKSSEGSSKKFYNSEKSNVSWTEYSEGIRSSRIGNLGLTLINSEQTPQQQLETTHFRYFFQRYLLYQSEAIQTAIAADSKE